MLARGIPVRRMVLTEQAFSAEILERIQRERPEIAARLLNPFFLLVEVERGKPRIVPLLSLYQKYCAEPDDKEPILEEFLSNCVYEEPPTIGGAFEENRERILPQIVPPSLVEFSHKDHQPLAVVPFAADLSIAFVVDEPERYCYISRNVMERWGVTERDLLAVAVVNLREMSAEVTCHQTGTGERAVFTFENFDGYDASRVLVGRLVAEVAAQVAGQLVLAIPHRDALVCIGDADPAFVAEMEEAARRDFEGHSYRVSPQLLTICDGEIVPYEPSRRRMVN
jgi:hypothetical protein